MLTQTTYHEFAEAEKPKIMDKSFDYWKTS